MNLTLEGKNKTTKFNFANEFTEFAENFEQMGSENAQVLL